MDLITETYLGWDEVTHTTDCPSPVWDEVDIRRTEGVRPRTAHDAPHACTSDGCTHADTFGRVQLRLLCRDCDTVVFVGGEALTETRSNTSRTGWGQRPTQHGGVWLWPGRPTIPGGEPHQYLVTLQAAALTHDLLYGIITGYHDASGAQRWIAGAYPNADGAHQICTLRWAYASNGLDSIDEAVAFIDGTIRNPQRAVVVSF
ncbi:hypothetical protein ACFSUJ_11995 [Streptomyces lusitanus]|uniref:Uncharacterized protein n=1 Tax=Streptomyces lusitanus TaxID=68232 RepID=A0ABU3JP56_9ACTN|nr:hypothetical protein [Streptomyces lusitanus]